MIYLVHKGDSIAIVGRISLYCLTEMTQTGSDSSTSMHDRQAER